MWSGNNKNIRIKLRDALDIESERFFHSAHANVGSSELGATQQQHTHGDVKFVDKASFDEGARKGRTTFDVEAPMP